MVLTVDELFELSGSNVSLLIMVEVLLMLPLPEGGTSPRRRICNTPGLVGKDVTDRLLVLGQGIHEFPKLSEYSGFVIPVGMLSVIRTSTEASGPVLLYLR